MSVWRPSFSAACNIALRPIIDSPALKTTLARVGFEAFSSSPKELDDFVKVQLLKWEKMIKDADIQPE
jgi:tripartite-type tricarboxylate transporter receptor subunit TctC